MDAVPGQTLHDSGDFITGSDRDRPLGDRCHDRYVVELLERAGPPPSFRRPAPYHDEGRAVEVGRGDGADPVGHARTRSEDSQTRPAVELGIGFGRPCCGLLMAGVDDLESGPGRGLVERPHVATVQSEHDVDAEGGHGRQRHVTPVAFD